MKPRRHVDYPSKVTWNFGPLLSWGSLLGRQLRATLTLDNQKRGLSAANRCYLGGKKEKSCDHNFIHYNMKCVVWHLLFSFFVWIPFLLLWKECFLVDMGLSQERKEKRCNEMPLYVFFGQFGRMTKRKILFIGFFF